MGGTGAVIWRGVRLDPRSRDMMEEVERLSPVTVVPTQGSYSTGVSASAGTHSGGGAIDLRVRGLSLGKINQLVRIMRIVGWAAWYRKSSKSWPPHIHGVAIGCPDLSSSAEDQVVAYRNGRDGLANNGPDTGPWVAPITWEKYRAAEDRLKAKEDEDMTPEESRMLDQLHGRLVRTGYVDMHMSAVDDVVLNKEFKDYVPGSDGVRLPLKVVGAIFSARRDAWYGRLDAAVARRLIQEQAKGVVLTDESVKDIVEKVKEELPPLVRDELTELIESRPLQDSEEIEPH